MSERTPASRGTVSLRSEEFMEQVMETYGGSVYLVALNQVRSAHDAQDIAQDVFVRLLTNDAEFADDEHLKAWLLRTCINRCHDLGRSAWQRRVVGADGLESNVASPSACSAEDEALSGIEGHPVWLALSRLPDRLRIVAHLHYVEELGCEEIAKVCGIRPATARTRLYRARAQMRKMLEAEEAKR